MTQAKPKLTAQDKRDLAYHFVCRKVAVRLGGVLHGSTPYRGMSMSIPTKETVVQVHDHIVRLMAAEMGIDIGEEMRRAA